MNVGQFGNGVSYLFIDRTGDLAALDMDDRNVHVGRGNCRSKSLVPIRNGYDQIWLEVVENRGKL